MELTRMVERLGLGRSLRPPVVLKDHEQYPVWKVETDSGAWAVKTVEPWGDFWLGMAAQSGALEAAAWGAGVAVPEPHSKTVGEAGLWSPMGDGTYARAIRFVEGDHPNLGRLAQDVTTGPAVDRDRKRTGRRARQRTWNQRKPTDAGPGRLSARGSSGQRRQGGL